MIEATQINGVRRLETLRQRLSRNFWLLILISLAHLPLGVLIYFAGPLAMLHPIGVFLAGLYWAAKLEYRLERAALAIGYLIGAEVLWRMAGVPIFWEFGKYAAVVIAVVALIRRKHYVIPKLPLAYLAVLLPGCVLTFVDQDLSATRSILSTQMSGPFFLLVACWYFSYATYSPSQLRQLFFAVVVPLLSVAFATLFFTVTAENIQFGGESNAATSGGFGPNQVSSLLGLGAFVSLTCLLIFENAARYRVFFLLTGLLFSAQSIMTFSRGGIYNAIGGVAIVALCEFQRPSSAVKRIAPIAIAVIAFLVFLFPVMNFFTGGQLRERFEDTGTAQRTEIAESDIQLFWDNPLLGVGVGASYDLRAKILDHKAMSHTEFSRLLSEHGVFGAAALVFLAAMIVTNFVRQQSLLGRAFVAGAAVWCCLFMTNAGMRMAAPSFMWGMMFCTFGGQKSARRKRRPDHPAMRRPRSLPAPAEAEENA